MSTELYRASPIKPPRRRATKDEMEERAQFLIDYADEHGPVTVRGLYYQAEVAGIPGIEKDDHGYRKVQAQVLNLRREGRLAYSDIADMTRWMRKPRTYDSLQDAVESFQANYRRCLWTDTDSYVEVWCEKDALAGVIYPVTSKFDVPLMVSRGFASETFCYEAVAARDEDDRPYHVYYLGDFDRAGRDAANSLEEKLTRFAEEGGTEVLFEWIAVKPWQIEAWSLPTRTPKRESKADKNWEYDYCCELDAIAPDTLRRLVRTAIEEHLPEHQLTIIKEAEASDRELLKAFGKGVAA